jgi:signal peptidase II
VHEMQDAVRRAIRSSLSFSIAAVAIVLADQATKAWVMAALPEQLPGRPPTAVVEVVPNLVRLVHRHNEGAAFSLFSDHPMVLAVVASVLAVGVLVWSFLLPAAERLSRVSLGMIFGGAVGNLIDRFRYDLSVIDFILIHWKGRDLWPTFNVADSAICVGVGLFFVASWLAVRRSGDAATR